MANEQNLKPFKKGELTSEEAVRRGAHGGIKSGEVRRAKKLFSQTYSEYLASQHNIIISGQNKKASGQQILYSVVNKILSKGDMSSVMLLKEMRQATEPPPAPRFDINKYFNSR